MDSNILTSLLALAEAKIQGRNVYIHLHSLRSLQMKILKFKEDRELTQGHTEVKALRFETKFICLKPTFFAIFRKVLTRKIN